MLAVQPKLHAESQCFPFQKLATDVLIESVVAVALGALCSLFMSPASISILVTGILTHLVINLLIRVGLAFWEYCGKEKPPEEAGWATAAVFATGVSNTNVLIHEMGHKLAADALLDAPQSRIYLHPFEGGATYFNMAPQETSKFPLIAAAGPALALGVSAILLTIGLSNMDSETGKILIISSLLDFLQHALYAISAFFANPTQLSHDFVALWAAGIHPLVSLISILAIPTIILIASYLNSN